MNERIVRVTPNRLRVIIGLGVEDNDYRAEALAASLGLEMEEIIEALDGLIQVGAVSDLQAEFFGLTEYGETLFTAIEEAMATQRAFELGRFLGDGVRSNRGG